jgi:signal transduction histidine kinase
LHDAIEYLRAHAVDVVLLDLNLPDSWGLATFSELHRHFPAVPIVVLSGLQDQECALEAIQKGAADYLIKGDTPPAVLERSTRFAIERKRTENMRLALLREQVARHQAEDANRAKDEFLAMLSHELRTPLNGILGWAALLRSNRLKPENAAVAYETIERSARAQAKIIDDLLDVSRITNGQFDLLISPLNFSDVVGAAVELLRPQIEDKQQQLSCEIPATCIIEGDALRLQQVVANVLSNASKFTAAEGSIWLCLRQSEKCVQLEIRDNGEGIHPDFLPHVWDLFRQADSSTSRRHGGMGVGLAMTRRLVELHGGTVAATSPGPGKGATFTLSLPYEQSRHTDQANEAT